MADPKHRMEERPSAQQLEDEIISMAMAADELDALRAQRDRTVTSFNAALTAFDNAPSGSCEQIDTLARLERLENGLLELDAKVCSCLEVTLGHLQGGSSPHSDETESVNYPP